MTYNPSPIAHPTKLVVKALQRWKRQQARRLAKQSQPK